MAEVNNRFHLLASLSLDDQVIDEVIVSESKQDNQQSTKNFWEIPDYVEKPIQCINTRISKENKPTPVTQQKSSRRSNTNKIKIDKPHHEEEQIEIEQPPLAVEINLPSIYPPQPYKFKPANASNV